MLKTGILRTSLSKLYLYNFCSAVDRLSTFSLIRASLARRLFGNMGDTFPVRLDRMADKKSNVPGPGGFHDSIKLNEHTPVDR